MAKASGAGSEEEKKTFEVTAKKLQLLASLPVRSSVASQKTSFMVEQDLKG
jgi:hypothetical protein